ncbi:hypothetical protein GLYMA_13G108450v4 [Glycine max]|nr:hypothetical protein GLYMA_13G108450v4 [Glycine max]KAH1100846.1 hypothetical protein GYH30_035802 [Glycine max]
MCMMVYLICWFVVAYDQLYDSSSYHFPWKLIGSYH